jgi:tetratricopeptide (TPR) repeat protein
MKRQTVSLCIIARDEEATIGMAIKSVLALVHEIVVVDTGSRDNTRIIAEGYGARVVDVAWEDDFAAARNAALGEAHGDWILILDADEILQPIRPVEFQRLLNDPGAAAYRLRMISAQPGDVDQIEGRVRLFRLLPEVRYRYPIFERITPDLSDWCARSGQGIFECELAVMHDGCDADRRARARERNLRILRKAIGAHPDEPYFHYRLACESLTRLDDEILPIAGLEAAIGHLRNAWQKAQWLDADHRRTLPWLADLCARTAAGLLALDRAGEARVVVDSARQTFADHPLILLQSVAVSCRLLQDATEQWAGVSAANLVSGIRDDIGAIREGRTNTYGSALDSRVRDLYPLRYLGELALLEGQVSGAVGLFEQALNLDPTYSFGWLGMAECSRFAGDRKRALKLYLRTVTENPGNHRAWLRGCDLMHEMDFHDNAASWWREVEERFPEHPAVRAARTQGALQPQPV